MKMICAPKEEPGRFALNAICWVKEIRIPQIVRMRDLIITSVQNVNNTVITL